MALTIESLKGLYEKLGGTNFGDVTTIPEAIDKISEVAESGGGGDEYKPIAVIAVETEQSGQVPEGWKQYSATMGYDEANYLVDNLQKSFFLGETKIPIVFNPDNETFCANAELIDNVPHILATPAYVFFLEIHGQQTGASVMLYSTETIANNTNIRIFEKTSGGETITVDSDLDPDSKNPVQNKVITAALANKMDVSNAPLVITGTTSGSTFTQTSSVTAEQIRDAIAAHRPIYIEDATMRLYYNYGGYTAADSFSYGFVGSLYDDTMNKRNDIFVVFEDSMATATMFNLKFSSDA